MIIILVNTEELNVREEKTEKIPITEVTRIYSRKRDSRDRIKYRKETILNSFYLKDSLFEPILQQMRLRNVYVRRFSCRTLFSSSWFQGSQTEEIKCN